MIITVWKCQLCGNDWSERRLPEPSKADKMCPDCGAALREHQFLTQDSYRQWPWQLEDLFCAGGHQLNVDEWLLLHRGDKQCPVCGKSLILKWSGRATDRYEAVGEDCIVVIDRVDGRREVRPVLRVGGEPDGVAYEPPPDPPTPFPPKSTPPPPRQEELWSDRPFTLDTSGEPKKAGQTVR